MELKNRIVMTAVHLGYTPQGEVTDRFTEFYMERAKGGVGLIIVGGCPIDEYGSMAGMACIHDDRFTPGLKKLTSSIQRYGAKIAAQLYQAGRYTPSFIIGGTKPFSASAVRSRLTGETPRALRPEEILEVENRFADAALRARVSGFDAVEILGSAGYLISQFLSPLTNIREDKYGGSLENRMRFGLEVAQKVRKTVGPDFPVIMRLAGNDFMKGGNRNQEAKIFASELENAGIDIISVTGGWHETRVPQLTSFVPAGSFSYLAQGIKSSVSVPVLASNRINDPSIAERVLRNGESDLVGMARALIADADLPNKASTGKNRLIYHCVACNQGCFDNIFAYKPVTCMVNPKAGMELELKCTPATEPKKVLVIGGGPAGLKTASIAAERGHNVTLVDKNDVLGGQILLNRLIPGKGEMIKAAGDLINNLENQGINILMGTEADARFISQMEPDVVVLASGAEPVKPEIPGIDHEKVVQAWDVLSGNAVLGKRVVIIGGNAVGLETALCIADQGTLKPDALHFLMINRAEPVDYLITSLNKGNKEVTLVEMAKQIGKDIGASSRWTVTGELRRLGVKVMKNTKAIRVSSDGLEIQKSGTRALVPADSIVIAAGARPQRVLVEPLKDLVPEFYIVGDAVKTRNAMEAIREGLQVGLQI